MTAPEDNSPDSKKSRATTDEQESNKHRNHRDLPTNDELVLNLLANNNGWVTREKIVHQLEITQDEADSSLKRLESGGDLGTIELSSDTLVISSGVSAKEAVAALSDQRERKWKMERSGDDQ